MTNTEIKDLCSDLSEILDVKKTTLREFLKVITDYMIHLLTEEVLKSTDGKLNNFDLEIPSIGIIKFECKNGNIENYELIMSDYLIEQVNLSINNGVSPLQDDIYKSVVDKLKEKYNSLF